MRLRHTISRGATIGGLALGTLLPAQQPSPIDRVAWLAGCWEQRGPDRLTTETWMPPFGGAMIGGSRTVIAGVLREFEHIRITTDSQKLVYTALPSGQRETKFPAITVSDTMIVFENLQHDFPQRVIYRKRGADSVIARIEGPGPNNTTRGTNFPMRRASCTTPPLPPDTMAIFSSTRTTRNEVWTMNLDGTEPTRLTATQPAAAPR